MKKKIVALNLKHLQNLIADEIKQNGLTCDLNHVDVSLITDMTTLFHESHFNGDISKWDVSNVEDMFAMFRFSKFNGDISEWDVSKVINMDSMFLKCEFKGDISKWKPFQLRYVDDTFLDFKGLVPYWGQYKDSKERDKAIKEYSEKMELYRNLNTELGVDASSVKKIKI